MYKHLDPEREVVLSQPRQDNALNILQVTARYAPFTGGTETHVKEVSTRLSSLGHHITILTTDPTHSLPSTESKDGVSIVRKHAWPIEKDYGFAPGLFRAIASGDWDIVHLQGYHTLVAPIAMTAALRARVPYVVSFHSGGHSSPARTLARGAQRRLLGPYLRRAAKLVPVSQFEARLFGNALGLGGDRFRIIPNGSNLTVSPAVDYGSAPAETGPLIVSVGRAERYKGHHRLIQALPYLRRTYPNARLRIAGDGAYAPALRQLADELGVSDVVKVQAIPSHDRDGMARLMSHASVVALLSEYEAHPVALIEALSLGKKILTADNSGMSELAQFPQVKTIPLTSSDEEVALSLGNHVERLNLVSDIAVPTWDDCAQRLDHLYREVIGGRRPEYRSVSPEIQVAGC